MTLGDFLSQMGMGMAPKQLTERYSHGEYAAPAHDPHVLYAYEPPPSSHGHAASSKHHHYGGGGHKSNAAMSALTLLSFLFFLHILQQCLRDHMATMSTAPTVMIMSAGRETEEALTKTDKAGITETEVKRNAEIGLNKKRKINIDNNIAKYTAKDDDAYDRDLLMKIDTADHTPKTVVQKYKDIFKKHGNLSLAFPGFVSAMDED